MSLLQPYLEAIINERKEKKPRAIKTPGFEHWGLGGGFWALVKILKNGGVVTLGTPDSERTDDGKLYELPAEHPVNPDRERESEDQHMAMLYKNQEEFDNFNENLKQKDAIEVAYFNTQEELNEILKKGEALKL